MKNQMGWLFLLVMAGVLWNQAEGSESWEGGMQLRTGSMAFSGFCSLSVLELDPWWRIGSGYS